MLQMERQRIIDARRHAAFVKKFLKFVAPLRADDILVIDVTPSGSAGGVMSSSSPFSAKSVI
ncbi:MAG: hypothetical protein ACLUEQ_05540 [Cloacibacillus evryensis]